MATAHSHASWTPTEEAALIAAVADGQLIKDMDLDGRSSKSLESKMHRTWSSHSPQADVARRGDTTMSVLPACFSKRSHRQSHLRDMQCVERSVRVNLMPGIH